MKNMRIFNKIMSVVLAMTMVLSMLPMSVFATQTEDDVGETASVVNTVADDSVARIGDVEYSSVLEALTAAMESSEAVTLELLADSREVMPTDFEILLKSDLTIVSGTGEPVAAKFYNDGTNYDFIINTAAGYDERTLTIGKNVTFELEDRTIWAGYYGNNVNVVIDGTLIGGYQYWNGVDTTVSSTGTLKSAGEALVLRRGATLTVAGGTIEANYFSMLSGNLFAEKGARITCGPVRINNTGGYAGEGNVAISIWDSTLTSSGNLTSTTAHEAGVSIDVYNSNVAFNNFDGYGASQLDAGTTLSVNGETADLTVKDLVNEGKLEVYDGGKMSVTTLTGAGTIDVEAAEGETVISGDVTGFTGTVEMNGADCEITEDGLVVTAPAGPDMTGDVIDVTAAQAQDVLDGKYGDITGKTINFTEDITDVLILARPTKHAGSGTVYVCGNGNSHTDTSLTFTDAAEFLAHFGAGEWHTTPNYYRTLKNVTFTADTGVTVAGFTYSAGHVTGPNYDYVRDQAVEVGSIYYGYSSLDGVTFKELTVTGRFDAKLYLEGATVENITFDGCTFLGTTDDDDNAAVKFLADTQYFTNVTVKDCVISDYNQGVYISGVDGAKITDNAISNTDHNAIALQSADAGNPAKGEIVVSENYITNAGDRAIRMNYVAGANIAINNNVMVDCGNTAGQLIKAESVAENAVIDLESNYWDGKDVSTAVASLPAPTSVGIAGGDWTQDVKDYVAPGKTVTINGEAYTAPASATNVAEVNGVGYTDLQEAIKAAAPAGTVELLSDVTVDKWIMISETLTIGSGQIITIESINGLTIDGNDHTLTINSIESASNGNRLFYDATELNVIDLTIKYTGNFGGIGLTSGTISNVTFVGGIQGVFPGTGNVTIEGCTFQTGGTAIYYEGPRDNLVVNDNTFELADETNVIIMYGAETFTNNTVISGRTVNVAGGSSATVSGNDFGDVRFKVYNTATATISDNTINNLVFNDESAQQSTFTSNNLSEAAQTALAAVTPKVAEVNGTEYATLAEAAAAAKAGDVIVLIADADEAGTVELPAGVTLNGNGKTITAATVKAGGDLTIAGNTTVYGFNPGWYNNTITIGEGASLKVTGGRITVSYGNTFNIAGTVSDAKTADKSTITPSLELTKGISFTGDGGDVQFNVTNAYVKLGDSTTKNSAATGTFNINSDNSIVDFTKTLKTYMPTVSGKDPVFNATFKDSVVNFASHLELWLDKTEMTVDNTDLTVAGSFANAGTLNVTNGSNFVVKAPIMSSHGGNTGTINVTGGTFELVDSNQNWVNEGTIAVAKPGKLIVNDFDCGTAGKITIDTTNMSAGDSVADYIVFNADTDVAYTDVATVGNSGLTVDENGVLCGPAGVAQIGDTSYATLQAAIDAAQAGETVILLTDVELTETLTVAADKQITLDLAGYTISQTKECTESYSMIENNGSLTITGNGKISFTDTSAGDSSASWGVYTIRNSGTLVVENGTIENLSAQNVTGQAFAHTVFAIFQYSGSTTINGGTISAPNYRSMRLWSGDMTINGGTFEGQVWVQCVNDTASLEITGGTFAPRWNDGSSVFIGNVTTNVHYAADVYVTGGTFTTKIGVNDPDKVTGGIVGGTFTEAAKNGTNTGLLADGFEFVANSDGSYGVQEVEAPQVTLTLNGLNLRLQDLIRLGFYFNVETEETLSKVGALMWTAEEYAAETDFTVSSSVADNVTAQAASSANRYIVESEGIYAQYLDTEYYIIPYVVLESGEYVYGAPNSSSALVYASIVYNGDYGNDEKSIVIDLLNYATAARAYFCITEGLAVPENAFNSIISESDRAINWSDSLKAGYPTVKETQGVYQPTVKGLNTNLKEAINLNFLFEDAVAGIGYWTEAEYAALSTHDFSNMAHQATMSYSSDFCWGTVEKLYSFHIYSNFYAMAYDEDENCSRTYGASVASYLTTTIETLDASVEENAAMIKLAKAMLVYGNNALNNPTVNKGTN